MNKTPPMALSTTSFVLIAVCPKKPPTNPARSVSTNCPLDKMPMLL